MSDDFLPIEINTESLTIREAGGGWELVVDTEEYGTVSTWLEQPDGLYDQLHQQDVLALEDGEVVADV